MSQETIVAFRRLSEVLTGHEPLNEELSKQYYQRIDKAFDDGRLEKLLEAFDPKGGDVTAIMEDKQLSAVAKEIIMLWYMSGFRDPGSLSSGKPKELGPKTPEQYFQGLFWPTIRAHPLGLSGGYFGYWKYPPEN